MRGGAEGRRKVAVLGGGAGALTAAFELTATEELRERFDVTVHQLGWRVGGKGASGRNAAEGNRIEEHGLHIWFGFYDNAFRVMRDAYEELGRPQGSPLATVDDAFKGCNELVLYDRIGEQWHPHRIVMPKNFMKPGDPAPLPTFWEITDTATRWALGVWRELADELDARHGELVPGLEPPWFVDLAEDVAADLLHVGARGAEHLLELADRLTTVRARHGDQATTGTAGHAWFLARLLTKFRDWLWADVVARRADTHPNLRMFFTMFDTIASTVEGLVDDGVLEGGFDVINDYEWSDWLRSHGAKDLTIGRTPAERAPVLRAVYDVAFGFVGGDISKANVAAGTATNDLLRLLFTYNGSLMYKMQAGMGDVVFTPLYEVLRRRGVRFEFFHAVTRLGLDPGEKAVGTIDVVPQVDLAAGADQYAPLVDVDGLDCWPSEPRWEQLADGDQLRAAGVNFEGELNPLGRPAVTLQRGVDFDDVVLGIPVGALDTICAELIEADERFERAIAESETVQTQAFQVWSDRHAKDLGWPHNPNSVAGCYVEPLDTYCDMSHLIPRESWGDGEVRSIAYFCGVLDERPGETAAQATARVHANALDFLRRDAQGIWPLTSQGDTFDWNVLRCGQSGVDEERFGSQYWRANVTPWERYVLTPAGSVKHRLPSDDSGFENLKLAGDWTKNGIDGGCVEAAVISGLHAGRSLTGVNRAISGKSTRWLQPRPAQMPAYVEYGGRATAPGPFLSVGGKLRSFLLQGDEQKIGELVRRTLDDPAGEEISYRAIGSKVLLMLGGFKSVSSMVEPFDRWGAVTEIMASFWIPVVAGRDLGDVFVAERIGMTAPYVFVDNPMSYLGGRETYGYAKTMARFYPEDGMGDEARMETYGGNFGRDEGAAWREYLTVKATGPGPENGHKALPLEGPASLMAHLAPGFMQRNAEGEVVLPGMRLAANLVDDIIDGKMRQIFLKQFRDAADGTRACYQSVVEAPIEVKRVVMKRSYRPWQVEITQLDSHPIAQELGVTGGVPEVVLEGELDMICQTGVEIGRVSASAPPATVVPVQGPGIPFPVDLGEAVGNAGDGMAELIRDAARVTAGIPGVRRFKWW